MKNDDEIMTAAEFFGETENGKRVGGAVGGRPKKRRVNKTFADIKARMVMRIYGVTRAKAEKIISERGTAPAEGDALVNPNGAEKNCGGDDVEMMSAEDFFGL